MQLIRKSQKLETKELNRRSYGKFFKRLFQDKIQLVKIVVVMFLVSALYVAIPFVLKAAVQKLYFIQDFHYIIVVGVGLIVAAIILGIIKEKLVTNFSIKFIAKLKKELYQNIITKSLNKFQKIGVGNFLATLSYNVSLIKSVVNEWGAVAIQQFINFLALFIASFFIDSRLALLFFAIVPIFIIYVLIIQYIVRKYALELMTLNKDIFDSAYKNLSDFKNIKIMVREPQAIGSFNNLVDKDADIRIQRTLIYQYNKIILHGISLLLVMVFIVIGGQYLSQQEMTFAEFVFFVLYIHLLFRPFEMTLFMSSFYEAGKIGIKTIFPLIKSTNIPKIKDHKFKGNIKLIDATYKHAKNTFRLSKINLDIQAGEVTTIVGDNNSGKSSFVQMLLQMRRLKKGKILFDDHDARELGARTIRKNLAVISRDYLLANTTIFNFLNSGAKEKMQYFDEKLVELCQELNLNGKIMSLGSRKYQSRIYTDDLRFSESEKIKLALIRAVYQDSAILILDNFWHDFDNITKEQIRNFIKKYSKNKTILQFSSRQDSLLVDSNKNFVLKEGKIV